MPRYKECNYCDAKAQFMDDIYGPTSVWSCGSSECLQQAAWDLWESSHKEVSEDTHQWCGDAGEEEE